MKPYLSVVIPAYNEEQNIKKGAPDKVLSYLKKQSYPWEVIFVDDGSQDETQNLLEEVAKKDKRVRARGRIRIIKNPHQGKAATVTTGVLAGNGEIVLFTDMDQSTPVGEVEKFFPFLEKGYDVVIGSRSGRAGAPIIRKLMAWGFVLLRTLILRLPLKDTQVGFKAFRERAAQDIFRGLRIFGKQGTIKQAAVKAGFDLEVLFIARKRGYKIKEVPVNWHFQGTMRVSPLRDSIEGLRDLLRIRWYAMKGEYR